MTLAALRQAFNAYFPNLSLSFFTKPQEIYHTSPVKYLITDLDMTLQQIQRQAIGGEIDIDEDTTAEELEAALERNFGLHVQVMRKDGEDWDQTSVTDHLTLGQQNELAGKTTQLVAHRHFHHDYTDARTEWYLG